MSRRSSTTLKDYVDVNGCARCSWCDTLGAAFKVCAGCKSAHYCVNVFYVIFLVIIIYILYFGLHTPRQNPECQRAHWSEAHREHCAQLWAVSKAVNNSTQFQYSKYPWSQNRIRKAIQNYATTYTLEIQAVALAMLGLIPLILDDGSVSLPAWRDIRHTRIPIFYMQLTDGDVTHSYQRLRPEATTSEVMSTRVSSDDHIFQWLEDGDLRLVVGVELAEKWKLDGTPEDSILSPARYITYLLTPQQLVMFKIMGLTHGDAQKLLLTAMQQQERASQSSTS